MSAHTKKRPTKEDKKVEFTTFSFSVDDSEKVFEDVPKKELTPLLKQIAQVLKKYESDPQGESIDFREAYKEHFEAIGGEPAYRESAHVVKTCREDAGYTQAKLAELLETDQPHISNIELATKPVGKALAAKLAKVFTKHNAKFFLSDLPEA